MACRSGRSPGSARAAPSSSSSRDNAAWPVRPHPASPGRLRQATHRSPPRRDAPSRRPFPRWGHRDRCDADNRDRLCRSRAVGAALASLADIIRRTIAATKPALFKSEAELRCNDQAITFVLDGPTEQFSIPTWTLDFGGGEAGNPQIDCPDGS